ncbi:enterotoxin A family protein [Embleya sp. NPDC001921]
MNAGTAAKGAVLAPLPPKPGNFPSKSLVEATGGGKLALSTCLLRGDGRPPEAVKARGGFESRGSNPSLRKHVQGALSGTDACVDSGYISMTRDYMKARKFARCQFGTMPGGDVDRVTYIYIVKTTGVLYDVTTFMRECPFEGDDEQEVAAFGRVPWVQVMGWFSLTWPADSEFTAAVYSEIVPNPDRNPSSEPMSFSTDFSKDRCGPGTCAAL